MTSPWWLGPLLIEASAILVAVLVLADVHSPVRTFVALGFMLICPGWAWSQLLNIDDAWTIVCVSVALSLALDIGVGLTLIYTKHASAPLALAMLVVITMCGVGIQLALPEFRKPNELVSSRMRERPRA
jgi:uncharacterized membrane protein